MDNKLERSINKNQSQILIRCSNVHAYPWNSSFTFLCHVSTYCHNMQKKRWKLSGTRTKKWNTFATTRSDSYRFSYQYIAKVKVNYLRGAFWRSLLLTWPDFPCPGAKLWHYATNLQTLCYISFVCIWLGSYQNHGKSVWIVPTETYRLLLVFCTINHTQSYKGRLFPQ